MSSVQPGNECPATTLAGLVRFCIPSPGLGLRPWIVARGMSLAKAGCGRDEAVSPGAARAAAGELCRLGGMCALPCRYLQELSAHAHGPLPHAGYVRRCADARASGFCLQPGSRPAL